jgi:hypothetical protein
MSVHGQLALLLPGQEVTHHGGQTVGAEQTCLPQDGEVKERKGRYGDPTTPHMMTRRHPTGPT